MRIRWHAPKSAAGSNLEGESSEFSSTEELLAHPYIASLMKQDFDHWEIAPSISGREPSLMRINRDRRFQVIGYLSMDHGLHFPEWKLENYPSA